MPRPKTVDKERILDAADELVSEVGGIHFTMDMVAAKAGVSKGGLTYTYSTKDALIKEMLGRTLALLILKINEAAVSGSQSGKLEAYFRAASAVEDVSHVRVAHLMAALANSPEHIGVIRTFYRDLLDLTDPSTQRGRHARQALLAIEGAFLLKGLGLADLSIEEWDSIFSTALGTVSGYSATEIPDVSEKSLR